MSLSVCFFPFRFCGWVRTSILAWMPGLGDAGGKKLRLPGPSRVSLLGERQEVPILSKVLPIVVLRSGQVLSLAWMKRDSNFKGDECVS